MTKTNNYRHDAARCLGGFSMHCVGTGKRRLWRELATITRPMRLSRNRDVRP